MTSKWVGLDLNEIDQAFDEAGTHPCQNEYEMLINIERSTHDIRLDRRDRRQTNE